MRAFRMVIQVAVFLFFAVWLLLLVTGIRLPLPGSRPAVNSHFSGSAPEVSPVKPSPIEILRRSQ